MPKILEVIRANARKAQRLEGTTADEFLRLLKELEATLAGKLAGAYAGDKPFQADMLNRVLLTAKAEIQTLENRAAGVYDGMTEEAVNLSIGATVDEITRLSVGLDGVALDVSLDPVIGLADPAQKLLANHFESSVERYGLDMLNQIRQKLFIGLRTGADYKHVARQVATLSGSSRANAERLVRTEVSSAYGAAKHRSIDEAAKQVPGLMKMWVHESDYPCDICIPLDKTQRPLEGTWTFKHGRKTHTVAHPPAHPHCSCVLLGMKKSWKSALDKLGYLPVVSKDKK